MLSGTIEGRIRRCGLVGGGVSLPVGFENSIVHARCSHFLSLSAKNFRIKCKLLATAPVCLLVSCCAPSYDVNGLTL